MHHVTINGSQVGYRRDGTGPGLVLVHGTGGDSETNWAALTDRFADKFTVIRPDYSGSGATVDDGRPLTVDFLADQIVAAARDAEAFPFHLVGFSLGAAVAAQVAASYPNLVRSLVLISGFASADDPRLKLQFETWRDLIATDRRALARLILLTGFTPQAVSALGSAGVKEAVEATLTNTNWDGLARQVDLDLSLDIGDRLAAIRAPTLSIGGTLDHMVAPGHARDLGERIAGARYVELPVGHLSVMEAPDTLAGPILQFLKTHPT